MPLWLHGDWWVTPPRLNWALTATTSCLCVGCVSWVGASFILRKLRCCKVHICQPSLLGQKERKHFLFYWSYAEILSTSVTSSPFLPSKIAQFAGVTGLFLSRILYKVQEHHTVAVTAGAVDSVLIFTKDNPEQLYLFLNSIRWVCQCPSGFRYEKNCLQLILSIDYNLAVSSEGPPQLVLNLRHFQENSYVHSVVENSDIS